MARGEYTSIGGERGGRHRHHRHHRSRGWGGYAVPFYGYAAPSYVVPNYVVPNYVVPSYAVPSYSSNYVLPAYDIADSGAVYNTGQFYTPSYGSGWPYAALPYYGAAAALPYYGAAAAFPHWRSPRHFMNRHRRRLNYLLGQDI